MTRAQSDGEEVRARPNPRRWSKEQNKQQIKTFTTMKKRTIFRTAWAVVSLALIALVCYWWQQQGCGVWSLVAAISFYGALSAGLMIAVEDVMERR